MSGVTGQIIFQESQFNPTPQIMRIIQYKTLRIEYFCHLYITYYLFEVTQHYNAKKEEK